MTRVLCRKAGDHALGQRLTHAFLDRRHELARIVPPFDLVHTNSEACAARQRLDAQMHRQTVGAAARFVAVLAAAPWVMVSR